MNLRHLLLASATAAVAALAGCYTGSAVDSNRVPAIATQSPTSPESESDGTLEDDAVVAKTGLPCDVAVLLKTSCGECHGGSSEPDGPRRIATYDDLVAPSSERGKSVAELAVARMKSSDETMPPTGQLGTDEIAILESWVTRGLPKGSCSGNAANLDGGSPPSESDAGREPSGPDPVSTCTSGVTATDGFGPTMRPGRACISCHTAQSGPSFTVAGTVFPSLHEPDNCNGSSGPTEAMKVLIIDAHGAMRALPVNAAGNFTGHTALPTPYRAIVVKGNSIREMKSTQTDGDCNNCHSERGRNGAPGRIMEPR